MYPRIPQERVADPYTIPIKNYVTHTFETPSLNSPRSN
jgi:hypothetical protein